MIDVKSDDIKLKMLFGIPVDFDGVFQVRSVTYREIITMNESKYQNYLSVVLFVLFNRSQFPDVNESVTNHDLLLSLLYADPNFRQAFLEGLSFFIGENVDFYFSNDDAYVYVGEIKEQRKITAEMFDDLWGLLMAQNKIEQPKEEEYDAGNELARKMIEKLKQKEKQKVKSNEGKITTYSLLSNLPWKSNNLNLLQILDLNPYSLYEGYFAVEKIDQYEGILRGIYAGTVSTKDINMSKIGWALNNKLNNGG